MHRLVAAVALGKGTPQPAITPPQSMPSSSPQRDSPLVDRVNKFFEANSSRSGTIDKEGFRRAYLALATSPSSPPGSPTLAARSRNGSRPPSPAAARASSPAVQKLAQEIHVAKTEKATTL